ncbi:MAG: PEPxxWA-CTERM sorting domain-containing protein [Candidatus Sphingomonas colombiensis]|nr:PEPxxWA-CTERM sorting domain-containing protein [Sphingomonas sp.]WEK43996.1 MAG: PEPxxWA-CTERM sorting domain-containing protein [Sphingomonas sp.]
MKNRYKFLAASALLAAAFQAPANAATVVLPFSGILNGAGAFSGQLTLDVEGGQALSGGGTISLLSYHNAPISLITTNTPYNENVFPDAPVGFRANDGTDFYGLDTAFPISLNGLLFAVGTSTPTFGGNPLLALYANGDGTLGSQFTGKVDGNVYYNLSGSLSVGGVPEPATWGMMILGFGMAAGALRYRRRSATKVSFA